MNPVTGNTTTKDAAKLLFKATMPKKKKLM